MKRRILWIAAGGIAGVLFILWKRREMADAAVMLVYTLVFSILLSPVCTAMERRGLKPKRAAGCAVIGLSLIILVMVAAFIPYMITQLIALCKRIAPIASQMMQQLSRLTEDTVFTKALLSETGDSFAMALRGLAGNMVRAGITTAAQIGRIAFALVLTYYVLYDRRRIGCHFLLFIPIGWRSLFLSTMCACKNALLSYFSGVLKTSAFVAAVSCAGLAVLGVQDALLLSLLMGILELLPYFGPILAAIPILLSSMLEGGQTVLLTLALLILVQQVEGNFVSPYFTASSTAIHPLAAILGVFIGGSLFGIWGILSAVPLLVVLQSVCWSVKQARCGMY